MTDDAERMPVMLPDRMDGKPPLAMPHNRNLLVIGANGAGKTRFTRRLVKTLGDRAFGLSPMAALYGEVGADGAPGIADVYKRMRTDSPFSLPAAVTTELDQLMALLLHEEVLNLIDYKMARAEDGNKARLAPTHLDEVTRRWKDMFPGNDVLIAGGRLLFAGGGEDSARSSVKLSTGEKLALYYIGAVLFAPREAVVVVDNPGLFLHPSATMRLWDTVESMRPDCRFVYTTHDLDFASSRSAAATCWVRDYDAASSTWDYEMLPPDSALTDEMYLTILGARRPVLFIEGDQNRSIDAKLYPLIFRDYTVKSLGSCDRVIESTRVFNSLASFHHLDSYGIVDRDRRTDAEVAYLRRKKILVPEVAEVENLLMLEDVIKAVAIRRGRNPERAFSRVSHAVMNIFGRELQAQALLHTRHYVKRTVECRIDGKFRNINMLERHMAGLVDEINPRAMYEDLCRRFRDHLKHCDYAAVLKVLNWKPMLTESNVASECGVRDKNHYIDTIIEILKTDEPEAGRIRMAVQRTFGVPVESVGKNRRK